MIDFTATQLADLTQVKNICDELQTQLVIIGAIAYKLRFPNIERYTTDIDLTVASTSEISQNSKRGSPNLAGSGRSTESTAGEAREKL